MARNEAAFLSEPGFVGFKDGPDVGTTLSPARHGEERISIFCLNQDS